MPAAPELRRVLSLERRGEVFLETIAEHQGDADCHIRVAREVAVELNREAGYAHKILEARVERRIVEDAVDEIAADIVSDEHFLNETGHDEEKALACHLVGGFGVLLDLWQQVFGSDDRTGEQRREEGEEKGIVNQIACRLYLASVDVDDVAYRPEGEERYAGGKNDIESVELLDSEVRNDINHEVEILEVDEHADVDDDIDRHDASAPKVRLQPTEKIAEQIVAQTDTEEYETALGTRFVIEIERESNDKQLAPERMRRQGLIDNQKACEEKEEQSRVEQQRISFRVEENIFRAVDIC